MQKNILRISFHNKQQAKRKMDGYGFFSRKLFKEKKKKKETRKEKKQNQHNRLRDVPLISQIQIVPENHGKERTISWKSPVTQAESPY